ncbi:MAG: T9SS type A sorting domain-containing protein [Bacteroidetes bacterium]|nr:T9SS type A sorting domain-containing protein [Bacteroidota bacterium]
MKLFRAAFLIITFCIMACGVHAQKRNAIWCFGDSALIDFNLPGTPLVGESSVVSRGSCVSIADTNGILQFYAGTRAGLSGNTTLVFNSADTIMDNGDSIVGEGWYKELLITPIPNSSNLYYLFSIGLTGSSQEGLFYSIIDMNTNGGLGAVLQKNIQLVNFKVVDGISAIKHANGRDFWFVFRNASNFSNGHYKLFISPNGISNVILSNLGSINTTNAGRYSFSSDGSKLVYVNFKGLFEIYDFDRCTGLLSNPVTIHPEPPTSPYPNRFVSIEFSESGRFLYASTYNINQSALFQYDLLSGNPSGTRDTLEYNPGISIGNGFLRRGPDEKIYFGRAWECAAFPQCYPYPDSVYNSVNMNLSVINSPDSLGAACNYTPFSFYLGGKRTYYGLPNNPDYDMPALMGSPCDTLVSQNELAGAAAVGSLHVYYHPAWEKAFINASNIKGKTGKLLVYDVQGKVVYSEPIRIQNGYYTKDLSMAGYGNGMYLITIQTEKERLTRKLIID